MANRPAAAAEPALRLRVAWGGGAERLWTGTIRLSEGALSDVRPLGIEADEPGSMWVVDGQVNIASRSRRAYDGLDVAVDAPLDARLLVSLSASDAPAAPIEIPLTDVAASSHNSNLDEQGNRLLVRRTPGDSLRVRLDRAAPSLVFSPGETLKFELEPHLLTVEPGSKVRLEMRLAASRSQEVHWSDEQEVSLDGQTPLPVEVALPASEGVYDLTIDARTRNRLRLWQSVAERKVQLVVVDPMAAAAPLGRERSLVQLAEIDPVEPLNPNWWNRFGNLPLIPGMKKGPLGLGDAQIWEHPGLRQKLIQLGLGGREPNISWEAYPLPIERPGEPHVLEVDYPSDVPQTLGISIVEPNAAGTVLPVGLDSGVYVQDEAAEGAPRWEKHRLLFWPRTRSPLVLFTNRKDGSPAVFGKVRLLGGLPRLPRAHGRDETPERLFAGYLDRPLFPENFSATESLDVWSGRSLDDWHTFLEGGTRLVDYLNHVGYNGLMLSVLADGSTIYPSELLEPTPRYDTGVFFGSGQDLVRKDTLELLLRLFDRENLRLIPTLHFSAPLPELEALRRQGGPESVGLEWIGADGRPWVPDTNRPRIAGAAYNVLHPRVQDAMLRVCRELVERYGRHSSFAGLAVALSAEGYAQLPGADCGYDDTTIALYERDHPQVQVPGAGPTRFAARARFLQGEQRASWLAWRAARLGTFYRQLEREVTAAHAGAKLYLAGGEMLSGRQSQRELMPSLSRQPQVADVLLELGIDPQWSQSSESLVFLRPRQIAPFTSLNAQATTLEVNQSEELDQACRTSAVPAALLYHPPQEARLESFDAKTPFKKSYTWLMAQMSPSGEANRQRLAHALAALDAQEVFDGGWLLPLGQEAMLGNLLTVYRRLPAERFAVVPGESQPVTVRTCTRNGRTCFYAVNDSPWKVELRLRAALPAGCLFTPLDPQRASCELVRDLQGWQCSVRLEAYDAAGGWFSAPDVALSQPNVTLPPEVIPQLEARIKDLGERSSALSYPRPREGWPKNHDFEEPSADPATVPRWSGAPQPGTLVLDRQEKSSGTQSVRLSATGPEPAWLCSDPIEPPETGRLAISVWLRVADASRQPPLRLAAEWSIDGRTEYRYAALGRSIAGEKEEPIPARWKQYVFPIPDLPIDGISQLRVRLDLMGPGEVWVDNVQLFDLLFDGKTELVELIKMISLHAGKLQEGKVGDCQQFLDSYWPRFLVAHVPLVNTPTPSEPIRTAAQPSKPAQPPKEEKKPGVLERLKSWVPERLRF